MGKAKSRFGTLDRDLLEEEYAADKAERGSGQNFWQSKKGENEVRLLPPRPGVRYIFKKSATHWGVGPNKQIFNCPRAVDSEADCFICEKAFEIGQSKNSKDKEYADRIRAKRSYLYNIIDLEDLDAGFQVAAFPASVHDAIVVLLQDKRGEWGDIFDEEEGTNLIITKKGKGLNTKYDTRPMRQTSALPDEILELLETDEIPDLATIRPVSANDAMQTAFEGGRASDDDDDDDDDDEDEAPKVHRKTRRVVVDEDDDDDDEEEEKPKRAARRPASRKASVEEDDDDDEDEDDEEEEVKPARKAPSVGSKLAQRRSKR